MFNKLKNAFRGKLTYSAITALAVGLVTEQIGVDIAPSEVDSVLTGVATALAIFGRWRATKGE